MKKRTVAILLCLIMAVTFAACGGENTEIYSGTGNGAEIDTKRGESLSAVISTDFSGSSFSGADFRACRLTMVNMWGTYCSPCIQEMPALGKLASAFGDDFQIIGIPVDLVDRSFTVLPEIKSKAEKIIEQTGASYRHIIPSKSLQNTLLNKAFSIPATVFVDSDGYIIGETYYGGRDEAGWREIIEKYLEAVR